MRETFFIEPQANKVRKKMEPAGMVNEKQAVRETAEKTYTVLVAVDFSPSSARALRMAKSIMGRKPDRIYVMHVIDRNFVEKCISRNMGTGRDLRKALFIKAGENMNAFLRAEGMQHEPVEKLICEGIPFLEINKKAVETDVDMVVMGNRGNSGDMQTIFFGSTTERVLRFMSRPVLCVPTEDSRQA